MSALSTATLIINSVTILLSLVMLVLLLWQDPRSTVNVTFSLFLLMVMIWSGGALISRFAALVSAPPTLTAFGVRALEIGFTGACVGLYIFTFVLTGEHGKRLTRIALASLIVVVVYQGVLAFTATLPEFQVRPDGILIYAFNPIGALLYLAFLVSAAIVIWQRQRKVKGRWLVNGVYGFAVGMALELISPELRSRGLGLNISAISTLLISYAMLRSQIIDPLAGRAAQLQAVRDVGLAITSRLRLEDALSAIAGQAAGILGASGAAIFLNQDQTLELAAVYNMPDDFRGRKLAMGEGLAGYVAATRETLRVDDYRRDWQGVPDMPFARDSFGSVVAAPLIHVDDVMGVLMVIEGVSGKRFDKDDMQLLELLGPQAAVAIANSRLFERQRSLTDELEAAKNQLEALLASTDNPVIALNRRMEVIFANPAAAALFDGGLAAGRSIRDDAARAIIPPNALQVLRDLHRGGGYTYEIEVKNRTYLCHISLIRGPKPGGYVAVMNDITQLKDLDRLKNQMIQLTSHNLKNPLQAAMSSLELLQDEADENFTEQMRRDLSAALVELGRMNRIVHNILNLESVQSGALRFEDYPVEQLILNATHDYQIQAAMRGIALEISISDEMPLITVNPHFITQALANLVENAVKYTKRGGRVRVTAEVQTDCVVICVSDTGIGIPKDALSRVFERFFRPNQPGADQKRGSGLGLSLVKAVVDAHGGRIWLESEINHGTAFYVALPIYQPTALRGPIQP